MGVLLSTRCRACSSASACGCSCSFTARRGQYADVERHEENRELPGVRVLRVEGGLFFANAEPVRAAIRRHARDPDVHAIVLDAEAMAFVDVSAADMLRELSDQLEREGVHFFLARDIGQVRDVMRRTAGEPEAERVYPTVQAAVDAARSMMRSTGPQ
jgi:sulfate permease, SulP family